MRKFKFLLILSMLFVFSGCYYVQKAKHDLFPEGIDHGQMEKPYKFPNFNENYQQGTATVTKEASEETFESVDEVDDLPTEAEPEVTSQPATEPVKEQTKNTSPSQENKTPAAQVHTPDSLKKELGADTQQSQKTSLQSIPIFSVWGLGLILIIVVIVIALLQQKSIREKIDSLFERFK